MPASSTTARTVLPAIIPVPFAAGLRSTPACSEFSEDFVRNCAVLERYFDHILLCVFDCFSCCLGNFSSLTETVAYVTVFIANDHESCETCYTTTFNGFGYTVHYDELFFKFEPFGIESLCHY